MRFIGRFAGQMIRTMYALLKTDAEVLSYVPPGETPPPPILYNRQVHRRLLLLREGKLLADTTPEDLLSNAVGKVWSVTTDTATALDLQARYQVSGMVSQRAGVNLRILSVTQPVEIAELVEPTLEDAYLVASGTKIAAQ
jgi:hypothetical protein